jgi:hypothetical protein
LETLSLRAASSTWTNGVELMILSVGKRRVVGVLSPAGFI